MWAFRASLYCCIGILILSASTNHARAGSPLRPGTGNPSPRLPRTSASQLLQQNTTGFKLANTTKNPNARGNLRSREQQLLNVFEVVVSTLEGKLQRIDNLDKAVEHLMRRVEQLDSRVADNIVKNDAVISKLMAIDARLAHESSVAAAQTQSHSVRSDPTSNIRTSTRYSTSSTSTANNNNQNNNHQNVLNNRLLSLDQKVTDIDSKLEVLKNQIDSNFLPFDDITAEASEKKPVSMNVIEITKSMNAEVINYVSKGLGQIRSNTETIDKKLQFHINIVSENLSRMIRQLSDIHEAVVDQQESQTHIGGSGGYNATSTTTPRPMIKSSKIDILFKQMRPIMTVSEKMDEVWDVVVGTKSSVDDLVPKSDELLTNTQRQERAIGEIHQDLRTKTNQIIENLDMVERRLKKQEDDVAVLAQRPVSPDLLMDPTIDRLVEYDPNRYSIVEEYTEPPINPFTAPAPSSTTPSPSPAAATLTATPQSVNIIYSNQIGGGASPASSFSSSASYGGASSPNTLNSPPQIAINQLASNSTSGSSKSSSRKGGVIFPSIKNKPSVVNTTFATDLVTIKDVKGFSCVDLLNAGMRQSGVYYLQIRGTTYWFLKVFCEQEIGDGGWTVIQRRDDFGEPRENFNRDWADYKNGFGDPAKEFWLGNENIYMLTNNEDYALRVELEDFEGNKRYAQYSHFKIHSEADYYKLEIDGYEGTAGDSLNDPWYGSNNSPFSTYNRDNDRSSLNCASMLKGGWWWKSCGRGLNGLYLHDPQDLTARQGIVWFRWRGWDYTLKKATMMIKPRGPLPMTTTATNT